MKVLGEELNRAAERRKKGLRGIRGGKEKGLNPRRSGGGW